MPRNREAILEEDDLDDEKEGKKGSKAMSSLIAVFIVIIWIAIFALLIKLDVGGFGSSVMYPVLKDVPVLNKILPNTSEEEEISQSGNAYATIRDAVDRINELENQIAIYRQNADDNAEQISTLTAELKRLQSYEQNQLYYDQLRRKFEEEVVFSDKAPDIEEYKEWYESINPDHAAELYEQVIAQIQKDKVIQDLADSYATMKPDAAAAIFEEMTGDLEKVANILSCMKKDKSSAILAAMDSTLAAKLTLLIYPTGD
ncbi:MAG: hypothetical protein HDT13_06255 [Butyrivibrio sp.]|nr:hypothetical protein [Butyrivibrio sp.]